MSDMSGQQPDTGRPNALESRGPWLARFLVPAARMSLPRQVLPGQFYLVTRRCTQRQFLLRPDAATADPDRRWFLAAGPRRAGPRRGCFAIAEAVRLPWPGPSPGPGSRRGPGPPPGLLCDSRGLFDHDPGSRCPLGHCVTRRLAERCPRLGHVWPAAGQRTS
jgi:hypothetical protein